MVCATTLDAGAARPPLIGVLRVPPCGVLGQQRAYEVFRGKAVPDQPYVH